MINWFVKNRNLLLGAVLGAVAGFLYWYFVGCASGSCMITSRPVNSTVYGAITGALLASILQTPKPKKSA